MVLLDIGRSGAVRLIIEEGPLTGDTESEEVYYRLGIPPGSENIPIDKDIISKIQERSLFAKSDLKPAPKEG